jgi:hypothetical protein
MKTLLRILGFIFAVGGGVLFGIAWSSPGLPWWWWAIAILAIIVGASVFIFVDDIER